MISDKILNFIEDKDVSFQITLDGNCEQHNNIRFLRNGDGSYDVIVRNIKRLVNIGKNVIVRINFTADKLCGITSIIDDFADLPTELKGYIRFDLQRVWQDKGMAVDEDVVDSAVYDNVKLFRSKGFIAECSMFHNPVRNSCYGDKQNYVLVNYNGDLYQCTARDFTKKNRYGWLADNGMLIYDEELLSSRRHSKFSKHVCEL